MSRAEGVDPSTLHFRVGHMDAAAALICEHHYSGRMAGNVQYVCTWHESGGLFGDYGEPIAACTFSIPGTRWSVPVLELSRLVRLPNYHVSLTAFISLACKMLKASNEHLIVSFADATQQHHGGIYQAASWNFSTFREPRQDGLLVNGVFVPGRSCNSRWGTSSPTKLSDKLGADQTVSPHMDLGKYLYWKAVSRKGKKDAATLGLECCPYPKPKAEQLDLMEA